MHDSLAVGTFLDPSLVTLQDLHVEVETGGIFTAGETVGYRKAPMRGSPPMANSPASEVPKEFKPNARVALDVDVNRFLKLLVDRIAG
jgi:inosine-uridine nucleoside N-ribohydrolase